MHERFLLAIEMKKTERFLLAIEMKKTDIPMNKIVYFELSILELSKMLTYQFWYDSVKPKNVLYGYRQFHCIHNKRLYFQRYCRSC